MFCTWWQVAQTQTESICCFWYREKSHNCENKLLIDSGCIDHFLTDQRFSKEINKPSPVKYVCNAELSKQKIHGIGSVEMDVVDAYDTLVVKTLEQALYVSKYKFNLISMTKLVERKN